LTDILKGRLGFAGFVVGDWNAHEEIPGCTKYACAAAILAGVDMLMAPDSWREIYKNTLAQARTGEIPRARIDDAVRRILRVKSVAGVFKRPAPKQRSDAGDFAARLGSPAHRALAREAVRKSLVLLKNDRSTLPLRAGARILVAGDAADSIAAQSGGWTIDWQGNRNTNADFPGATSIFGGIQAAVSAGGGSALLSQDGRYSQKPDAAIVVFGEGPYAEFEGDRENLEFSPGDKHELELLKRLRADGIPVVTIFLSGRPLWVNPYINASDAFVAAWLPGSEGEGVADVLFGSAGVTRYDFTGRLAFSWPDIAMPVTFDAAGHVSGALFALGSGLDYRASGNSPVLREDPRIPPQWAAAPGSLFHARHVTAPWSIFVADDGAEVHLTTQRQESPRGAVAVSLQGKAFRRFGRARKAAWSGYQAARAICGRRPAKACRSICDIASTNRRASASKWACAAASPSAVRAAERCWTSLGNSRLRPRGFGAACRFRCRALRLRARALPRWRSLSRLKPRPLRFDDLRSESLARGRLHRLDGDDGDRGRDDAGGAMPRIIVRVLARGSCKPLI